MYAIIKFFFLFAFLFHSNLHAEEYLLFDLDLHHWKLAFKNSNPQASIVEFILKDESPKNWTEMVTVQKMPATMHTVDQIYFNYMQGLQRLAPINSKVICQNENALLFEWWISDFSFAQHEWFKIIQTPSSLMILRYTTKKMDQIEQARSIWEKILEDSTVCFEDF